MKTNFSVFRLMLSPALALAITIFSTALILWGVSVVQAKRDAPASAQAASRAAALLPPDNNPKRTARLRNLYGKLPLQFEANQGQSAAPTKFIARGQGYNLSLLPGQAVLRLRRQAEQETELVLKFVGANTEAALQGEEALPGKSNYFVGNDPTRWQTNVATFAKVKYQNLYPGVDLVYYGQQGQLEYDFLIAPGANARPIQMAFDGVQAIQLDRQGQLALHTKNGVVRQLKPVIYQTVQGKRREIQGRYILQDRNRVGFQIGKYNHSLPLVIDPILEYSTFIGGTSIEQGVGIAVDKDGNAYLTGDTFSTDFPVAGTLQPVKNNVNDAFVLKLNAAGSAIVYAAYLGGAGSDTANSIALDAAGNVYLTGVTSSADFPLTSGALQSVFKGLNDAFITKINAAGTALVYSSYLGGTGRDVASAIAVDSAGSAYITGRTDSPDLPATGIQTTRNGALAYKTLNSGGA